MYNLQGKVALVTGAGRYPSRGPSIALRLAQEGADVAVNDVYLAPEQFTEGEKKLGWRGVPTVQEKIEALGRRGLGVWADVSDPDQVDHLFEEIIARLGRIDILVNNAAIIPVSELLETSFETWNKCLTVNLAGAFLCGREAARHMIRQGTGGKIVNISSRAGKVGLPELGAYSASKFGIVGLTQVMAVEWARYKINVNAICRGAIAESYSDRRPLEASTPEESIRLSEKMMSIRKERLAGIPLGRLATHEDLANLVCFLASDQSDFITGESVDLTGGHTFTQKGQS